MLDMKRIKEIINLTALKKRENYLVIVGVALLFILVAVVFLSNKIGKKEIDYVSPYVDDCSFTKELIEGITVEQSFSTELDVIEGIYLETATFARKNTSNIRFIFFNEKSEKIYEEIFSLQNAVDNQYSYFGLSNPLSIKDETDMILQIEAVGNAGGNGVCLVQSNYNSYSEGELFINGEKQAGDCFFSIAGYKYNYTSFNPLYIGFIILLLIYLIVFCTVVLCKKEEISEKKLFGIKISYIKVAKIFLVFCSVISIGKICYSVIDTVLERTQIEYMVYIDTPEAEVAGKSVEISFLNQGKNLISNNIMIKKNESYTGEVRYSIVDTNENVIIERNENISNLIASYSDDWDELIIKCSDLELKQGEKYTIFLEFGQVEPVYLIKNGEGQVQQRQIMENSYRNIYKCFVFGVAMIVLLIIAYSLIIGFSSRVFLVTALATGVVACFIQVPCAADDEYRHFLRAYDLANNNVQAELSHTWVNAKGNIIINDNNKADIIEVSEQINRLRLLDVSQNYDNISYDAEMNYRGCIDAVINLAKQEESGNCIVSIAATNEITALAYLPQVIFMWIGRIFSMGAVGMFYMARIGNMLFATLVTYFIVKALPEYKNIFYVIYFAPNVMWLRASCNRDAFVTAIVTLLIAYIVYVKVNKLKILSYKRVIILSILVVIVAICKLPYILITGLLIILGKESLPDISSVKCFLLKVSLIMLLGIIGVVGYKISTYEDVTEKNTEIEEDVTEEQTHISYALQNPQKVGAVFGSRILNISEDIYRALEGYKYQFIKDYLWMALIVILFGKSFINIKDKVWNVLVFGATWLLILVVGYTWMPPDYGYIWGVNPRYMIPMLPILGMIIALGNDKTEKIINLIAPTWILTLSSIGIISMITVYW